MPLRAVIGGQWGDEGKGKMVDYFAQDADVVARFNGGPNAGHTVWWEGKEFKLHVVTAGIFNPRALSIIGNGVLVDPEVLPQEMIGLESNGVSCQNLKVSKRAHLIMPWHILLDKAEEESRGAKKIGTTQKGIGPAYADKAARKGIRAGDLLFLREKSFKERLYLIWKEKDAILRQVYGNYSLGTFEQIYSWLWQCRMQLELYLADTEFLIHQALESQKLVLVEGAQGVLLDIEFGTYPDVTSSVCTPAGICQGLGIFPPRPLDQVIGIMKAYASRVGSEKQPFPTKMPSDIAHFLREKAHEYGATSGRPRWLGWFDAFLARLAVEICGFDWLALTRLDNLAGMPYLRICRGYQLPDGRFIFNPRELSFEIFSRLEECEPVYESMPSWESLPSECQSFEDLPPEARKYVERIEELVGSPIKRISYGREREQVIVRG